jgi:hypothetical protein
MNTDEMQLRGGNEGMRENPATFAKWIRWWFKDTTRRIGWLITFLLISCLLAINMQEAFYIPFQPAIHLNLLSGSIFDVIFFSLPIIAFFAWLICGGRWHLSLLIFLIAMSAFFGAVQSYAENKVDVIKITRVLTDDEQSVLTNRLPFRFFVYPTSNGTTVTVERKDNYASQMRGELLKFSVLEDAKL